MAQDRIYVTTPNGHVTAPPTVVECDDDQQAIGKACRRAGLRGVGGSPLFDALSSRSVQLGKHAAVTPLDQLRLRLPDHDFDRLMQAAKPIAPPERDAFLKDIGAELGRYEVVGPGLLHRIISEVQRRYDIADQRRTTG